MRASLFRLAESFPSQPLNLTAYSAALLPPKPLYRQILRAHRTLAADLRFMGDGYVKSEFRRHQAVTNPVHIIGFLSQWKAYLDYLPKGPDAKEFTGKKLDPTVYEKSKGHRLPTAHCPPLSFSSLMSSQAATVPTNNQPYADLPSANSKLFEAKARKGLTFDEIAKAIGKDEVWTAAAFYGQAKFTTEELHKVAEVLDLPSSDLQAGLGEHWWPNRGLGPIPPTDPVIYRLYESVLVYGHSIKAIIHEKINIDRKADPKGDRVVLTFE
ncbi:Cyanate hydratase [Mycena venus]|uniref:Cyanate hydratase n=1 Tax=Mycena venus TaxID=2733690 RepID=A0A8H6Y0T8_9AGAR|nr:Cyanate hydratase [Mycena venus]